MNIAIFSDSYLPTKSGIVTVIVQLREQLIKLGHNVVLVTVETTDEYETYDPSIYRVHSIPLGLGTDQFLGVPAMHPLVHYLKEKQIDIIHCHTEFGIGKAGLRAAHILHIPAICTTHTMWTDFYRYYIPMGNLISPKIIKMIMCKYYEKFNCLIGVSTKAHNYFKHPSMIPEQPSIIIPNSIDKERFQKTHISEAEKKELRKSFGIKDDETMLLFVGRTGEEKRVFELLDVCSRAAQKNPKIKTIFVGDGPALKELKEKAEKLSQKENIHFPGFIEWTKVHAFYESADIFVTCSMSEMHSMTILEAQLSALPIITRKEESYFDSVFDNENGYLCDSEDQMVEKIVELSGDKQKLKQFSQKSLEITKNFSIATNVSRTVIVYQQVLKAYPGKINEEEVSKLVKAIN